MKDNGLQMCMLYDFYGAILSDRQQEMFDLYYNDDLSLAEVAELVNISRQGVRDAIQKSVGILAGMEDKLHLVQKFHQSEETFKKIEDAVQTLLVLNRNELHSTELADKLAEISVLAKQNI